MALPVDLAVARSAFWRRTTALKLGYVGASRVVKVLVRLGLLSVQLLARSPCPRAARGSHRARVEVLGTHTRHA